MTTDKYLTEAGLKQLTDTNNKYVISKEPFFLRCHQFAFFMGCTDTPSFSRISWIFLTKSTADGVSP